MTWVTKFVEVDKDFVYAAVDAETVIEIGDLVWQDVDNAKPASMIPRPVREYVNASFAELMQEHFADKFLGVAMQWSRPGDTNPIRVATTGVFKFNVQGGECFELGEFIGPSHCNKDGLINRLQNQRVTKVAHSKYAVGRVAKRVATAATDVLVDIRSTVMTGGVRGSIA